MRSEFLGGRVVLHGGDSRDVLKGLADASIDSCVCDPPYALVSIVKRYGAEQSHLHVAEDKDLSTIKAAQYNRLAGGFMGKKWDTGEAAFAVTFWAEIMRVLKPGGHVVAFSGTRTYHRLACAIEDAGFEIRDQLAWAYGSGFPKSHDAAQSIEKLLTTGKSRRPDRDLGGLSRDRFSGSEEGTLIANTGGKLELTTPEAREWQGWGTALKPAWEPIVLARKSLAGTVAANVLAHGTGALNIDGCRVGTEGGTAKGRSADKSETSSVGGYLNAKAGTPIDAGRWPANIVHDGSDEVVAAFPSAPGQQRAVGPQHGAKDSVNVYGDYGPRDDFQPRTDSGSAARFFASFPQEDDECTPSNANDAESIISPSNEHVASVLNLAVARSMPESALTSIAFPEPSMSVTPSELRLISATATELMQSLERRFSLGLPPENITTTISHVQAVAIQKPIGTTTITISLSKSSGYVELVTFNTTPQNLGLGAKDSASAQHRLFYSAKADKTDRMGSGHPTVKPVDLMQWLCRLVTPPGGTVLDPFAGSGSTGEAAWREGFSAILIEREEEYQKDIAARLELADAGPMKRRARAVKQVETAGPLFGAANDNGGGGRRIYGKFADQSPDYRANRPQALRG